MLLWHFYCLLIALSVPRCGASIQSECVHNNIARQCRLAILCWMDGGRNLRGCGSNQWLYSCCIPETQMITRIPTLPRISQSVKHNRQQNPQQTFLKRRYDESEVYISKPDICGIPRTPSNTFQKRILGGRPANFAEYPWQAHIRIKQYQCGGALVSRRFVVTAGHCVSQAKLRDIIIYLGELDTQNSGLIYEPLPSERHTVSHKLVHPRFKFRLTQPDRYDVAVLRLKKPAGYKAHILPICLPNMPLDYIGKNGFIAGWGKISQEHGHTGTNILRTASVPVISKSECIRWHQKKDIHVELFDEMMCAGFKNKTVDACLGDSGGPLSIVHKGRYYLIGITSAGFDCGRPLQPGIYHNVQKTYKWIQNIIRN